MVGLSEEKSQALLRCNKCGFCLAHCPIYKVTGLEWASARGRITVIRSALLENQTDISELEAPVFNCLTCNACVDDCPAGVKTADIIFSTREELLKRHGDSRIKRLVFQKVLTSPSLVHKTTRLLRLVEVAGLRSAARKTGLIKLLGDTGKAESMVPRVPSRAGLKEIRRHVRKIEQPKYRAAYFVGCYAANMAPGEAAATIHILNRHLVDVTVPEFGCCGIAAPAYGDMSSARSLARKNIDIARTLDVDAIVTPCASCSSSLKDYGKLLAHEPEWAERARDFSSKVKDLSEFLCDIGLVTEMGTINNKVTYHDPCHLARYQKIKQQPRNLLKNIPGIDLIELREADMCCGAAGTYGFKNYDLSMKVLARKMDNIEKSGAEILLSSCPACIMQLSSGIRKRKMPVQAISIVELLDKAYQTVKGAR
ncbi:MAG: (Fe-S)-binding protein [Chloroflexi bacterium]|nr:(Fe-S)-binding protein [Chloroflexota bacterium]